MEQIKIGLSLNYLRKISNFEYGINKIKLHI